MDTRKLNYYGKKYWRGTDVKNKPYTAYAIAQDMKKADVCKYDMDCYRKLLLSVQRQYRD